KWFTNQSRSTNLPTVTSSFAALSPWAMSSSTCEAARVRLQVREQRGADQTETKARRDQRNEHGGGETGKDKQGSLPRYAPCAGRHAHGIRIDQYLIFEDVVGDVDADKQPRVKYHRRRCEPGARNPCGGKRQERDQEEMGKVHPYQARG